MRWAHTLVILSAAFSLIALSRSPFSHPDEFNYISGARTMVETGDWVTPRYNFAPRIVKPALFYWIVAGAFKIVGPSIYAARLCSAASAIAGVAMVGLTARHLLGRRYAGTATLLAASQLTIVQLSRFAITDTTLWVFCCLAHYAFFRLQFSPADDPDQLPPEPRKSWPLAMLFFTAVALAFLTKGPIALLWCALPCPFFRRDWKSVRRMHLLAGIVLATLIVLPWAWLFVSRNFSTIRILLWNPSSPESYAQFSRPIASPLQFFGIIPLALMTILPWIPAILISRFTNRREPSASTREQTPLIFWIGAIIVLLGLAHRKDFRYLVPLAVPTALLLAPPMHRLFTNPANRSAISLLAVLFELIFLATAIAILTAIRRTHDLPVNCLWPLAWVMLGSAVALVVIASSPRLQPALPAILLTAMFLSIGVLDWQTKPLTQPRPDTLAPQLDAALRPDQSILCYHLSARELMYLARRPQLEMKDDPARFASELQTAQAVLVRESDWMKVPDKARTPFTAIGECVADHSPAGLSFNLADYRERALLLVHQSPTTQP